MQLAAQISNSAFNFDAFRDTVFLNTLYIIFVCVAVVLYVQEQDLSCNFSTRLNV